MRLIYIAGFAALASASALAEPLAGVASEAAAAVDAFQPRSTAAILPPRQLWSRTMR